MVETMITYQITEFAKIIGVSASTLRNWDRKGVLLAYRSPLGNRIYTQEHYEKYVKMTRRGG